MIGSSNNAGSTATFTMSDGLITVIEKSGSGNSGVAVGTPNNNGGLWIGGGATSNSSYTGMTNVDEGGLCLGSSSQLGSDVSVATGASFGGNGTVNGDVDLLGTLKVHQLGHLLAVTGDLDITGATLDATMIDCSMWDGFAISLRRCRHPHWRVCFGHVACLFQRS